MNAISTAIVVDTPYQIMSAVSYVTNHMGQDEKADIYIDTRRCVNYDMKRLFDRVKGSGLFENVVELNSLSSGKFGIQKKLANYYEWLFPKSSIKRGSKNNNWDLRTYQYDKVVVSGPFMLQRNFISMYPHAKVIFIEDGSGSYSGEIGVNGLSNSGRFMQKILHRGPRYVFPKECYLYSPLYYEGAYTDIVRKLIIASVSTLELLFDSSSGKYKNMHVVYFDQPKYSNEMIQNIDEELIRMLQRFPNIIVRPHPQLRKRDYKNLNCDTEGLQWEIVCSQYVSNNSILIGKYSTAQLTPKLMFDLEPIVIFTHRLYGIAPDSSIDKDITRFRHLYNDKKKVIICESKEELEELLFKYA